VAALLLSVRQHITFKSSPGLWSEQADIFVLFTESFDAERCKCFLVCAKVMASGRREESRCDLLRLLSFFGLHLIPMHPVHRVFSETTLTRDIPHTSGIDLTPFVDRALATLPFQSGYRRVPNPLRQGLRRTGHEQGRVSSALNTAVVKSAKLGYTSTAYMMRVQCQQSKFEIRACHSNSSSEFAS